MKIIHRNNSNERKHYLLDKKSFYEIKPQLLYSGSLSKTRGWNDVQHTHEFLEIIFIIDGKGKVTINGNERQIQKGDIIIYNAGNTHAEQSSDDSPIEMVFVAFDKIELPTLPKNHLLSNHYDFIYNTAEMYDDFKTYFQIVMQETSNKEEFYIEISQNAARALLMYLFRLLNQTHSTEELVKRSQVLNNAINYINDNFLKNISLEDVADHCFVNKYYLSHLFTEYEGLTIGQFIYDKKIDEAKRLLKDTELSVSQIAQKSGFNDISYFSRAFKKSLTLTPSEYRKSVKT